MQSQRALCIGSALVLIFVFSMLQRPTPSGTSELSSLGFSHIFVISLAARKDRRRRMNALARTLNLNFTFLDAEPADSAAVRHIMQHVRQERTREGWCGYVSGCANLTRPPSPHRGRSPSADLLKHARGWSEDSLYMPDAFLGDPTSVPLGIVGADMWPLDPLARFQGTSDELPIPALAGTSRKDMIKAQTKLHRKRVPAYNRRPHFDHQPHYPLPWWRVVSPAAVACWHSHVQAIRILVASGRSSALILEDDVDVEIDIKARLDTIEGVLPPDWDMISLGHCWSDEAAYAPIDDDVAALRPANAPKCNHAYAVSRTGAIKLLRHLRSPAFAYSRAFDQALVQLIITDRINAFSVEPSIIIQTKDTPSDIVSGNGSNWRDALVHGALEQIKADRRRRRAVRLTARTLLY